MQTIPFYRQINLGLNSIRCNRILVLISIIALGSCAELDQRTSVVSGEIRGVVLGKDGPVVGAVVMRQTGRGQSSTNSHGEFRLTNLPITGEVIITAWAPGYYNSEAEIEVGDEAMIELRPIIFSDNQDYSWLAAHKREDQEDNCQNCHSDPSRPELKLPFDSWSKSAHANSAINPIFRSVYLGQDLEGNQSPLTRYGKDRDYGAFPLPPSKTLSYYGPGYKLDFPNNSGNCATCHTPMAALSSPLQTDPTEVGEIEQEGVGCDICHKIKGVILDKGTGLPHERMTGVLSYRFHRPEGEDQLFLGPKVDVVAGDDSYSPLHHQSRFCAGCHSARFWGVEIYNSYGEWLNSTYADNRNPKAKSCQECHMPVGESDRFALLKKGGLIRDPETVHLHRNSGSRDSELLKQSVELEVAADRRGDDLVIKTVTRNIGAGHHLPTGSPLRHLVLRVRVVADDGSLLTQRSGPNLPEWMGEYVGQSGQVYAKVLEEFWTGITPTIGYWNQTRLISDNRIPANGADQQEFSFHFPQAGATVEVELIYVRALPQIREWKGWPDEQVVMAREVLRVR